MKILGGKHACHPFANSAELLGLILATPLPPHFALAHPHLPATPTRMAHRTCPRCGTTRRIYVGANRLDKALSRLVTAANGRPELERATATLADALTALALGAPALAELVRRAHAEAEAAAAAEVQRRTDRLEAEAEARLRTLQTAHQAKLAARAEAGGDQ